MLFNLPPLTNMSDTEYSGQERVETMYTVEVLRQLEGMKDCREGLMREYL